MVGNDFASTFVWQTQKLVVMKTNVQTLKGFGNIAGLILSNVLLVTLVLLSF